ncbi:transposase [uncultured Acidaminococcus sp.]|uniref:transposase n=1 Tax=uncultured Acidaminococcus sp. TaxID=352152 RepID=UPI0026009DA9|nr:transposase [uncultured Acidaminococcus sp.]
MFPYREPFYTWKLKEKWKTYAGAIRVWESNFQHVEQLFNYPYDVRQIMYTTSAIESINRSFRKVTKKGTFTNDQAVMKLLYLRAMELIEKKWKSKGRVPKWQVIRNQLLLGERVEPMMLKYDKFINIIHKILDNPYPY